MVNKFDIDVTRIRDEARKQMQDGPVTASYAADKDRLIDVV